MNNRWSCEWKVTRNLVIACHLSSKMWVVRGTCLGWSLAPVSFGPMLSASRRRANFCGRVLRGLRRSVSVVVALVNRNANHKFSLARKLNSFFDEISWLATKLVSQRDIRSLESCSTQTMQQAAPRCNNATMRHGMQTSSIERRWGNRVTTEQDEHTFI